MKITISGSIQFESQMSKLAQELVNRGYEAEWPKLADRGDATDADDELKANLIKDYYAKINTSEALLVFNESKNGIEGYIGGSTLIEMAHAFDQGLDIFLMNPVPDLSYADEIRGMQPTMLGGNLDILDSHVESLPRVFMSTTSTLKHDAMARAMRKAGIAVRADGAKVESGVNEQPLSVEEVYEGAINRHTALKKLGEPAAYYATIESGQHQIHKDHSSFGCNVVIIEPAGSAMKVGIGLDVEYPQTMLDKVPSLYPDLGTLVMEEYGATEKDPFPYFTDGRLTRRETLESAVYNVAIQLGEKNHASRD